MKPKLAIWGASGHALVVADILRLQDEKTIVGFIDDTNPERNGQSFGGSTILGGREILKDLLSQETKEIIIAVGDCASRLKLSEFALSIGFRLGNAIHPSAIVARDVIVGNGVVVAAAAVINPGCVIGKSVIVNTSASIDHECVIEDAVHISPGAHLAGKVSIGKCTWIGMGTNVIHAIHIGSNCVVGAGSLVLKNINDDMISHGVPARSTPRTNND